MSVPSKNICYITLQGNIIMKYVLRQEEIKKVGIYAFTYNLDNRTVDVDKSQYNAFGNPQHYIIRCNLQDEIIKQICKLPLSNRENMLCSIFSYIRTSVRTYSINVLGRVIGSCINFY